MNNKKNNKEVLNPEAMEKGFSFSSFYISYAKFHHDPV